eukprot:6492784-Amphidinium_carterae.7
MWSLFHCLCEAPLATVPMTISLMANISQELLDLRGMVRRLGIHGQEGCRSWLRVAADDLFMPQV